MRLIQPAPHHIRIVGGRLRLSRCAGRGPRAGRRRGQRRPGLSGGCCRRRWGGLEHRRHRTSGRIGPVCWRQHILIGLSVGDELVVARSAGARRRVVGHAACPVRPMIGDISGECILVRGTGARREHRANTKHNRRRERALDDHARRCGLPEAWPRRPFAPPIDRKAGH